MTLYLTIFYEFFKTGLLAVGGGLATLPFIREMSLNHPEWFSLEQVGNMIAVSNSAPGPIGINLAAYAGYEAGNIPGAILAVVSLVLPAVIIILAVVHILDKFMQNKYIQAAFTGIRPAVTAMIVVAGLELVKVSLINTENFSISNPAASVEWLSVIFAAVMFVIVRKTKFPIIIYIIAGAVFGILVNL